MFKLYVFVILHNQTTNKTDVSIVNASINVE